MVQEWFQGMNPQVEDLPPARWFRDGQLDDAGPKVLADARAFWRLQADPWVSAAAPEAGSGAWDPALPLGQERLGMGYRWALPVHELLFRPIRYSTTSETSATSAYF